MAHPLSTTPRVSWAHILEQLGLPAEAVSELSRVSGPATPVFSSLTSSSKQATPESLFFAIPGTRFDGMGFVQEAHSRGAAGFVIPKGRGNFFTQHLPESPYVEVDDVRRALALTCPLFFPQAPHYRAAITGTNGKTSVAHFTRHLLNALGVKAASMGTLGLGIEEGQEAHASLPVSPLEGGLTTADPVALHRCFQWLAERGIQHCALEASSHGLDQKRLDGTSFQTAVWTNFSRDHLDYHPSLQHYQEAKEHLFRHLLCPGGRALFHRTLPNLQALRDVCHTRGIEVWTYGFAAPVGDLGILATTPHGDGQTVTFSLLGQEVSCWLPLGGLFQAENILAAMGIVHSFGYPFTQILEHIHTLPPVPGRLEGAGTSPAGGKVYVDYAHTPHALETALSHLRPHTTGRLHLVFGCGGNRDPGKRGEMGRIAQTHADHVWVTDDNPRDEDPATIRAAILATCPKGQEIGNRGEAIAHALSLLASGDTLLVAGKGHEREQIGRERVDFFDDRACVQTILDSLKEENTP